MRHLLLLFLITHSSLDKTHDIHYKTIIWHNHVRYLTVLILTPTPFWQCQHFMSSCFSASSWQHDTWGMCAAGRSCASHRRTGDRRGAARSMRWTRPWAPAAPINVVSAVITTTKIIIIVQRHHHEQLEPGAQKERLLERNLNCCILYFFFWEPCTSSICGPGQPGCRHSSLIHSLYLFCKYNNQQCFCF